MVVTLQNDKIDYHLANGSSSKFEDKELDKETENLIRLIAFGHLVSTKRSVYIFVSITRGNGNC